MKIAKILGCVVPVAALVVTACAGADSEPGGEVASVQQAYYCETPAHWECSVWWGAKNSQRMIKGPTDFECVCGVPFHSCGPSGVDIVGGLSQSCDNNTESFYGSLSGGEWHGCTSSWGNQANSGEHWIQGINQFWDRWPTTWRSGTYYGDLWWLTRTDNMRNPYATIYDLDTCANKQLINSLYWPNFPITAQLVAGDPSSPSYAPESYGSATWRLTGSTPMLCSDQDGVLADSGEFSGPKRPPVCSDLVIEGSFSCYYYPAVQEPCPCEPSGYCY